MRVLCAERPQLIITSQQLDEDGYGHMVLTLNAGGRPYSLIAYSRALDAEDRTDRVIATKWDASFCLFDGVPDAQDISDLAEQVTSQEAGRYHDRVLTLSRANKSVRLFEQVVQALASGQMPDYQIVSETGYLMRTTAVYGNGKFGIADRSKIAGEDVFNAPFQAEMLTVFLIREYSHLLAEYCARQKNPDAPGLSPDLRRALGIGNSTGLGMAPFLMNHPCLIHSWMLVRETALQRARSLNSVSDTQLKQFHQLLGRALIHIQHWQVPDPEQMRRNRYLITELEDFIATLEHSPLCNTYPLNDAFLRCQSTSEDMQELMVSLLLEVCGEQIDGLAHCLSNPFTPRIDPAMTAGELAELLNTEYQWALEVDLTDTDNEAQFWYVSEAKLEPRLGMRFTEPGADREMPFHLPRYIQELRDILEGLDTQMRVAEVMLNTPHLRYAIRRVQNIVPFCYGEIRDNLVAQNCRPIDLLRCKLSFFGASHFDPKSDRWTRVTLFKGAPTAAEIAAGATDDWLFASP